MDKRVIIATNNAHKVEEITSALDFEGWRFETLREAGVESNPLEDGETFVDNARIKARAVFELTGCATLADDSGLIVDALDGAPGVHSSRYAGEDGNDVANNEKLLRELAGVADEERTARFACVLVFLDDNGDEAMAEGFVEGRIGQSLTGNGGFGYDPLFLPDEFNGAKTMAEVTQDEKNAISHRGNALRALKAKLQERHGQQR